MFKIDDRKIYISATTLWALVLLNQFLGYFGIMDMYGTVPALGSLGELGFLYAVVLMLSSIPVTILALAVMTREFKNHKKLSLSAYVLIIVFCSAWLASYILNI